MINYETMCALWTKLILLSIAVIFVNAENACQTPSNRQGECIPIQNCPSLLQLLRKRTLTEETKHFLRNSQCGYEDGSPKVCCQKIVPEKRESLSCLTPNSKQGACVVIDDCPPILDILKKRPLSQDDISYLKKSKCGEELMRPRVCCPKSPTKSQPSGNLVSDLLPTVCGEHGLDDRIIMGNETGIDEFPWMVLLLYTDSRGRRTVGCGGVLISPRYVLSAAHCLRGDIQKLLGNISAIRLGEWNTSSIVDCVTTSDHIDCNEPPIEIAVEEAIPHPGWSQENTNQYNDISIIRMAEKAPFTDFIRPICLPMPNMGVPVGKSADVAGWGRTETGYLSPVKLKANLPIVEQSRCARTYLREPYGVQLGPGQFCAGGEAGRDSCRGDSGGPLMYRNLSTSKWYAIGVVSFGPLPCGQDGFPGVYTKVSSYINWMLSNMY